MSPCGPCADMASVAAISSSRNRMRASDDCQLICSIPRDTHLTIGELSYPCILLFLPPNFPITRDHLHSFQARTRHAKFTPTDPAQGYNYRSMALPQLPQLTVRRQQPRKHTPHSVQGPSLSFTSTILRLSTFVILLRNSLYVYRKFVVPANPSFRPSPPAT